MDNEITSIKVSKLTREKLNEVGNKNESYNDLLLRFAENSICINPQTKQLLSKLGNAGESWDSIIKRLVEKANGESIC